MAKKNLCGLEIEFPEDKEFHSGMFHCYGATRVDDKADTNDTTNNFVTFESENAEHVKIIAMCPTFEDAKFIVNAMSLAKELVDARVGIIKDTDERLRKKGYDLEMMNDKIKELINKGKSPKEISDYMLAHHSDFLVEKPDAKPTDDSKERW